LLSGDSSTLKPSLFTFTTLKQAPFMAILFPSEVFSFAFMVSVEPTKLLTVAISRIKPVKMINSLVCIVKILFCHLLEDLL